MNTRVPDVHIRAYRVAGGAVVHIERGGRRRRYRIGCRRFLVLRGRLGCGRLPGCWSGFFGRSSLEAHRWPA